MKKVLKVSSIVLGILLLCISFLWFSNDIGASKNSIEEDARGSSKIKDDWQVAVNTSDTMSAMVFYPENKLDHSFQVYVNHSGLSFGYFFRSGGDIIEVENYIAEFSGEGYNDRAFISMNSQRIEKLEIDDGGEIIAIDSNEPFAIVLPKNIGSVTFYDINGDIVDTMKQPL